MSSYASIYSLLTLPNIGCHRARDQGLLDVGGEAILPGGFDLFDDFGNGRVIALGRTYGLRYNC